MKLRLALSLIALFTVTVVFFAIKGPSDILFTVLAFVAGICVGVAWDDAWDLFVSAQKDAVVTHEAETPKEATARRRFNSTTALGWSLILASLALLAVGVMLIVTKSATESYSKCTAEWQQAFGEAYSARVAAATEVSEAMDAIVLGVATDDREAFDAAVQHYVEVREQQQEKQAANPLPPLPEALCGQR